MKPHIRTRGFVYLFAFVLLLGCTSVPSTADLPAVTQFEVERYLGTWHEIARLPQWFERDLHHVSATYTLEDGQFRIVNRGMRDGKEQVATAIGHFKGKSDIGELRVSFFRPFYGDYRIIWLSPAYDCALVTSSDRSTLWLLARTPTLPQAECNRLLQKAATWGFDTTQLEFPQP